MESGKLGCLYFTPLPSSSPSSPSLHPPSTRPFHTSSPLTPQPSSPAEASRRAKHILEHGTLRYTRHALEQMQQDLLTPHDIERALRGHVEPAEWENQQWRYRFSALRVWAVASFRGEDLLILVTAWRSNR